MTVRHVEKSMEFECDLCHRVFVCVPQLIERWASMGKSPREGAEFWDIDLRLYNPSSPPAAPSPAMIVDGDACRHCVRKILTIATKETT